MRNIILLTVCALVAQTVISQQYFSKTYPESLTKGNFINNICITEKGYIKLERVICNNNKGCDKYVITNKNGDNVRIIYKDYFRGNTFSMVCRNDTIFYSGRSNSLSIDSTFYWYFGMLNSSGDSISEYKIKILHLNDTGNASIGSKEPLNYGLTVVNNREVILYGEGIDKSMPNPNNVPYRALFIRLGLDGVQKGGNIWFELNENRDRRLGQVITDRDGEAIFPYVQFEKIDKITGLEINTSLVKMYQNNQFTKFTSVVGSSDTDRSINIVSDSVGNYYTVATYYRVHPEYNLTISDRPYLTKINKVGKVEWTKLIPHIYYQWDKQIYSDDYYFNRITTCQNGDILCVGSCFVLDSFSIPGVSIKVHSGSFVPFMTRFDNAGNLVWHHFVVPQKTATGALMRNSFRDIKEDTDGSILVAGQLERDDANQNVGDAWLMRLSPQGCLNDACDHIEKYWHFPDTIVATQNIEITALAISPNPASDYMSISISEDMMLPLQYEIINIAGKRVEIGSHSIIDQMHIETDNLQAGLYIVQLRDKRGKVWRGKVVVE